MGVTASFHESDRKLKVQQQQETHNPFKRRSSSLFGNINRRTYKSSRKIHVETSPKNDEVKDLQESPVKDDPDKFKTNHEYMHVSDSPNVSSAENSSKVELKKPKGFLNKSTNLESFVVYHEQNNQFVNNQYLQSKKSFIRFRENYSRSVKGDDASCKLDGSIDSNKTTANTSIKTNDTSIFSPVNGRRYSACEFLTPKTMISPMARSEKVYPNSGSIGVISPSGISGNMDMKESHRESFRLALQRLKVAI